MCALTRRALVLATVLSSLQLAACGGSSSSDNAESTTTISGRAVAGDVTGTIVVSLAGDQIATGSVTNGDFSIKVPDSALGEELDLMVTGSYTDEVSGDVVTLDATNPLALRLGGGTVSAGTPATVGITPETTVIRELVANHGLTLTNAVATYQAELGNAPDGTGRPFAPNASEPAWADAAARDVSFRVGAFSQWADNLGLAGDGIGALPAAIAADLADGVLDGNDGSGAVTIGAIDLEVLHKANALAARYLTAMATFAGNASVNVAALPYPSMGLPPNDRVTEPMTGMVAAERTLSLSDGRQILVQVKLHNTAPFDNMQPRTARTVHRVSISEVGGGAINLNTDAVLTGVTAGATMHMLNGRHHSTPMSSTCEASSDLANGICDISLYYVMASAMSMGGTMVPMGIWDLNITLADAVGSDPVAVFHPNVAMTMGATLSSKGGDPDNQIPDPNNPGMTMGRPYWVWLDSVTANAGGGHDIALFVTTKVGMTFPAVYDGANYSSMGDTLTLTGVTLEASADGATWTAMTEAGDGRYSVTGLNGLASGGSDDLWVRVTLDIGGSAHTVVLASGANPKLTFAIP